MWVAHAAAPDGGTDVRVAYAVGRPVGTAVVRNRVRRRLRAVIRELESEGRLTSGLHLVGARPDIVGLDFADLRAHVTLAVSRCGVVQRPESP